MTELVLQSKESCLENYFYINSKVFSHYLICQTFPRLPVTRQILWTFKHFHENSFITIRVNDTVNILKIIQHLSLRHGKIFPTLIKMIFLSWLASTHGGEDDRDGEEPGQEPESEHCQATLGSGEESDQFEWMHHNDVSTKYCHNPSLSPSPW